MINLVSLLLMVITCTAFAQEVVVDPSDIVDLSGLAVGDIALKVAAIVGVCSALVQLLVRITAITPGTKDDAYATMAQKALSWVIVVLDRLALNPDKSAARKR